MNRKIVLAITFVSLIVIVLFAAFAGKKRALAENEETTSAIIEVPSNLTEEAATTEISEEGNPIRDGHYNPLTGLFSEEDLTNKRPIVVMFDNFYAARPQAGLAKADIVYEILAEGLITRYMGVFYGTQPDYIGPVRSSRPYFVIKALEFDPYYVHVGGSMKALSDIKKYEMADIDGLSSGAYWREKHKKAPHNVYTSSEILLKDAKRMGYRETSTFSFMDFHASLMVPVGEDATEITFVYKEPTQTDKIGYNTSYKYNDEEKLYYRYTNGKPHLDEDTKEHLTCTNILVQYAKTVVIDNEGRLDIDLITTGKGKYYTAGKVLEVTWKKTTANDPTFFYDESGQEIKLNPGVTWIQVVKTGNVESIK
ncbi:MAG TPA: DUF3048 domain-containing protein [Clostridiales bacterium UBA8960]|jgi:hypothetical protein|nr:DUF3048 domain-containing protein [Clostridiales bacterium UBA8960]